MRIVHITLGYPPAAGWGGPTGSVSRCAAEQARRGHDVHVICTNLHSKRARMFPGFEHRRVDGVDVRYCHTYRFKHWPGTVGPLWTPKAGAHIRSVLAKDAIVHVHGIREILAHIAVREARRANVPYVIQPHGELPRLGWRISKTVFDRLFVRRMAAESSGFVAMSERELTEGADLFPDVCPRAVVGNGWPVTPLSHLPARGWLRGRLQLPESAFLAVFAGRLNWIKGIDLLIEAVALASGDIHLAIIGPDEGQLANLQRLAQQRSLGGRVHFVGPIAPVQMMQAVVDADVVALASRKELFPNIVLEACVAGVPVLLPDTCEIASTIADRGGLLVRPTAAALAEGLDRLHHDGTLRRRLQTGARTLAETELAIGPVASRLDELYNRAIAFHQSNQ